MFKNIKISFKLWFIVLPAIITLGGLLFLFITRSNEIEEHSKQVLYDEVFISTASILNADRDFYQAAIAEKELLSVQLTSGDKEKLINDFEENAQQVRERMTDAIDNIKANSALYSQFKHPVTDVTMEQLNASFEDRFNIWLESYDVATKKGELETHYKAFDDARANINLMTELLEAYAQSQSEKISEDVDSSAKITAIVVGIVILFILSFSTLIIVYLRRKIKYITDISQRIAGGELALKIETKHFSKDELGLLCRATGQILEQLNTYVKYIDEITDTLKAMADGDMRMNLQYDYTGEFKRLRTRLSLYRTPWALHWHPYA